MPTLEQRTVDGVKQVLNPITNKWVKASGESGKKLLGNDICQLYPEKQGFEELEHQKRVSKYFLKSPYRGICLNWGLGSGKSCGYATLIDAYLSNPKNPKKVFMITSGSLRENFVSQYCSFCGKNTKDLLRYMTFISYNYSGVLEGLPSLNNSLIVIDEIHNILNARVNGSDTIGKLYEKIEQSKNSRIVVGSGTILVSHLEELYYLMKLLKPESFYSLDNFLKQFEIVNGVYYPINEYNLSGRMKGVIDYLRAIEDSDEQESNYPKVKSLNIFVPVNKENPERVERLIHWRINEMNVPPPGDIKGRTLKAYQAAKTRFFLANSMLKSRQMSNFIYPSLIHADMLVGSNLKKTIPEEPKNRRFEDDLVSRGGWITPDILKLIELQGEKINAIVKDVIQTPGKHVIYSSFKTYYGEYLFCSIFDILKIRYVTFDGEMDDQDREETLTKFNSDENVDGSKFKVLIMTDSGAEGITLLAVKTQHILEQSVSEYLIEQVMGRCNRYKSHNQLPKKERTLTIKRYFLDVEKSFPNYKNKEFSPDIIAYKRGQLKKKSISYMTSTFIPSLKLI